VAGAEDEAFEEIVLPEEPAPPLPEAPSVTERAEGQATDWAPASQLPAETGVAEPPPPTAEFEVEEEAEVSAPGEFEVLEEEESEVPEGEEPAYQVNDYTLFRRDGRTGKGRVRTSYFFSTEPFVEGAAPSALPEDHEVLVNPATGVPVIRKSQARVLPVIEIEGLGPVMAERLERVGVRTTKDLLRIDVRRASDDTGISERLLRNFRAMAELLQVSGIYPDQAAALVYAGVRSAEDLRNAAGVGAILGEEVLLGP
jgi:hypothetical protein